MAPKRKRRGGRAASAGRKARSDSEEPLGIVRDGRSLIIALRFPTRAAEVVGILSPKLDLPLRLLVEASPLPAREASEVRHSSIIILRFPTPDLADQVLRILNSERKLSLSTDEGYVTDQESAAQKDNLIVGLRFPNRAAEAASILCGIRSFPLIRASDFKFEEDSISSRLRQTPRAVRSKFQRGVSPIRAPKTGGRETDAPMAPVERVNVNGEKVPDHSSNALASALLIYS